MLARILTECLLKQHAVNTVWEYSGREFVYIGVNEAGQMIFDWRGRCPKFFAVHPGSIEVCAYMIATYVSLSEAQVA